MWHWNAGKTIVISKIMHQSPLTPCIRVRPEIIEKRKTAEVSIRGEI